MYILRRLKTDARLYINKGLSPVFILMKQAKKNSFKMLPSLCSRASCAYVPAIFRNHVAKTISLLASRMPVRLEFFFSFVLQILCSRFYYIIHVVSFVQETLEKRLSSCQNVWFCYCTEINIVIYVLYTKQGICGR